ncbi:alpha/beta hydrolase [Actinocorallia longicatena]|uniref:Alpha/beta hydrolase n=1 Tax=Actinocorallia longicatena TaxID=111803 RepID=A0ABP6Q7U1_9ACTN
MSTVISADGTTIGYTRTGSGPSLVLVDGAFCYREFGPSKELAGILSKDFTVYAYDRRGRGESDGTRPSTPQREIEDLAAVVKEAGGEAFVLGLSSGAVLGLEAAANGVPITRLAMYEAPMIVDDTRDPAPADFEQRMRGLVEKGNHGAAVKAFMRFVEMPAFMVAIFPLMPPWKKLKAVAPTLPNDLALFSAGLQSGNPLPAGRWDAVTAPTLVMGGGKSPTWMKNGVHATALAIPGAVEEELPGQTHMVKAAVLAPAVTAFFKK